MTTMPPPNKYADAQHTFFRRVMDLRNVPYMQEVDGVTVITPAAGKLVVIYGRLAVARYTEDRRADAVAFERGQVFGEWFSTLCVEGELGHAPLEECEQISAGEFSQAFQKGWQS